MAFRDGKGTGGTGTGGREYEYTGVFLPRCVWYALALTEIPYKSCVSSLQKDVNVETKIRACDRRMDAEKAAPLTSLELSG